MCALQDVVTWKGQLFFEDKAEPEPRALPGSLLAFTRNGESQGVAYRRVLQHSMHVSGVPAKMTRLNAWYVRRTVFAG